MKNYQVWVHYMFHLPFKWQKNLYKATPNVMSRLKLIFLNIVYSWFNLFWSYENHAANTLATKPKFKMKQNCVMLDLSLYLVLMQINIKHVWFHVKIKNNYLLLLYSFSFFWHEIEVEHACLTHLQTCTKTS